MPLGRTAGVGDRPPAGRQPRRCWQPRSSPERLRQASARLAQGGWVAVSAQIAAEHHTGVGGSLTLQTPTGRAPLPDRGDHDQPRVAAGCDLHGTGDYSRYWGTHRADRARRRARGPGSSRDAVRARIERALGPGSGLEVSLASARAARIDALAGEGLGQLGEISTLLLLAAIVAMAAALASSIWQRRPALAGLRLLGVSRAVCGGSCCWKRR